jgi:hypothetical protein
VEQNEGGQGVAPMRQGSKPTRRSALKRTMSRAFAFTDPSNTLYQRVERFSILGRLLHACLLDRTRTMPAAPS